MKNLNIVSWEESGQLCLLASIMGQSREIFTPKLDAEKDQHLFTAVAKKLVERIGYELEPCDTEEEARQKMADVESTGRYPGLVFTSDTTGEKAEEVFSSDDEEFDDEKFKGVRVVKSNLQYATLDEVRSVIADFSKLFEKEDVTKEQVIAALTRHLPTFSHLEKNKYLDQRM